jgi:DNA-binding LytR/AlgR family response regulator
MASILIVEDERLIAAEIGRALRRLGHTPLGPAYNSDAALDVLAREAVELVLMDINIDGDTDGIATALLVRRRFAVPVVFLTAQSDPATLNRAKLAHPYGYILKPFTDESLRVQIELALHAAHASPPAAPPDESAAAVDSSELLELPTGLVRYLFVRKGNAHVKVRVEDILYVEALENYAQLVTTQGKFLAHITMRELETRLADPPFFRAHRSHLVNLDQVQSYEEGCVIFGRTDAVPVSRSAREALKRRLNLI